MVNIKSKVTIKKGIECTEEWLGSIGLKDPILKTYRVKKDTYYIQATGEMVELHKHGIKLANKGRVEAFYVVMGDNITTEVFKLISEGNTRPNKTLIQEANNYVYDCLIKKLNKIEAEQEEDIIDLDDLIDIEEEEEEYIII